MKLKVAVYTGSNNLYPDMVVAAKSLLINSDVDLIYLLIEDDNFPFSLPDCIKTINVSDQSFFDNNGPNMKSRYSYLAMMRAALCFIFPDLDRVLSLDVDTIVNKNISDIWDLPIDDFYFAASREEHRCYEDVLYTNMGVTLFNLEKLRNGKAQEVIDILNKSKFSYVEQDVFNCLCQGMIYNMPSCYNVNTWTDDAEDEKILHYAGIKEWQVYAPYLKYQGIPFSDIRGCQNENIHSSSNV